MSTKTTLSSHVSGPRNRLEFSPPSFFRPLLAGVLAIALVHTANAASETWVGNSSNATSGSNWTPTSTTTSGDSWAFGTAGSAGATLNNDLTAGFSVAGITFNSGASAFTIGGTQITLSGNITNSSTALQTIDFNITGTGNRTFSSTNGGGNIVLGGVIGGSQNVTISSTTVSGTPNGTVTLSGNNTYSGNTTVGSGTLVLNSNSATGNSTTLNLAPTFNSGNSSVYLKLGSGSGVTITGMTLVLGGNVGGAASATLQAGASGVSTWDGNISSPGKTLSLNASYGGDLVIGAVGAGRTISGGTTVTSVAGNVTINSDIASSTVSVTAGNTTFNGNLTGSASATVGGPTARLILNSTNSSSNGTITINSGTLVVPKLADTGTNSSVGSAGTILSNGGTLQYIGTGDTSNRTIQLNGSSVVTIDQSGSSGLLKLTGDLTFAQTNSAHTLQLQGSTAGTGEFSGTIANAGTGATAITKSGTGTWTLSGNNSYTGVTTISGGTLAVTTLANGGSNSSIGAAANTASTLLLYNGTTLQYTGAGGSTDRLFRIGNTGANGDSATLDASGTGAINFTNNVSLTYDTNNRSRTLNLAGNSTADNTLAALIASNGSGVVSVTKNGVGKWILTNANTYTGNTTISGGLIGLGVAQTGTSGPLGNSTAANSIVLSGGGLQFTANNTYDYTTSGRLQLADGATGTIDTNGQSVTFANAIGVGAAKTGGLTKEGSGTLTLSATNTYNGTTTITAGTLQVNGSLAAGSTVNIGTAGTLAGSGTINGNATLTGGGIINKSSGVIAGTLGLTGGNWNGSGSVTGAITSSSGTFTIGSGANLTATAGLNVTGGTISAGNGTSTITGSVNYTSGSNSTYAGVIAGTGKTLTLNNSAAILTLGTAGSPVTQTYTGATNVTSGTLVVNGTLQNGGITVSSGATLGGNITAGGTTTIQSGGFLAVGNSPGAGHFATLDLAGTTVMEFKANPSQALPGSDYDTINVSAALAYGGELRLTFLGTVVSSPTAYDLFSGVTLTATNSFSSVTLYGSGGALVGSLSNPGSGIWSGNVNLNYGSGTQSFTFTQSTGDLVVAVPEPATWALLAFSLTTVMVLRRRRNF